MNQRLLRWLWRWPPWIHTLVTNHLGGWRIVRRTWLNRNWLTSDREEFRIERWRKNQQP